MKFEIRVFRNDKAQAVHIEEYDGENPISKFDELAFKNGLGQPLFPIPDNGQYTNGFVSFRELPEKD